MKTVFVFGNADLEIDSLPLKILPELEKKFPDITFEVKDPNEEWRIPDDFIVIDTVLGLEKPAMFDDLEQFSSVPRLSMHDFDALTNLRFLKKLGKIKKLSIIGLPPDIREKDAIGAISGFLK